MTDSTALFDSIKKYGGYISLFVQRQQEGNYATIATYETPNGEIVGYAYTSTKCNMYVLKPEEIMGKMNTDLSAKKEKGEIKSFVILYHANSNESYAPSTSVEDLNAIAIRYQFGDNKGVIGLPYSFGELEIAYGQLGDFSQEQQQTILNTKLDQTKDYFTDMVELVAPSRTNAEGITITSSNNTTVAELWSGVVGFEQFRSKEGQQLVSRWMDELRDDGIETKQGIDLGYYPLRMRAAIVNNQLASFYPVMPTSYSLMVENSIINEWEDTDNALAIIRGRGKDTFGVQYLATDYAVNRELYHAQKMQKMHMSGIILVLDKFTPSEDGELTYSEDFTSYMHNSNLDVYGCFDFIGKIEELEEVTSMQKDGVKAYQIKVKLITNPDEMDFFTLDMFVNQNNMRIDKLEVGMRITGAFLMQGEMVNE